jgi:hypothetical protein
MKSLLLSIALGATAIAFAGCGLHISGASMGSTTSGSVALRRR